MSLPADGSSPEFMRWVPHDEHAASDRRREINRLSEQPNVIDFLRSFYQRVDEAIAVYEPRCTNRGQCCNFARAGHRLFVTPIELAAFRRAYSDRWQPAEPASGRCPWQIEGVCTTREFRPLGCRVYFCDPQAQAWQNEFYEARLRELKQFMAEQGIQYRYEEWLSALSVFSSDTSDSGYIASASESLNTTAIDPSGSSTIQLTVVNNPPARPS